MSKNKALLFVLAILMFVPSFIAIRSYTKTETAPIKTESASAISISDLDGTVFSLSKEENASETAAMLELFAAINAGATKVPALPDPLMGTPFFKVTVSTGTKEETAQYYFSVDPENAYYVAADGSAYKIAAADAAKFIATDYAASLYTEAKTPVMTLASQYEVSPVAAEWSYKNYTGDFVKADVSGKLAGGAEQSYELDGGFDIAFDTQPDYMTLKVADSSTGSVLFDDLYENIGNLKIDRTMTIDVDIEAKWYEDSERNYYGSMMYSFSAKVGAPAEFYLGKTTIQPGEFVAISAKNVASPSKITFSSSPDIGFTPVWFTDGEYAHALVPINMDLAAGDYVFSIGYGSVTQDITLTVTERKFLEYNLIVNAGVTNSTRTEETLAAFEKEMLPYAQSTSEAGTRYFDGTFGDNGSVALGFGRYVTISSNGAVFRHLGVDYIKNKGADVTAVNAGKVIYTGYLDYSGYTVVVEHGYGLKSWYCHLGEVKVAVGDTVEKGSVVGAAGDTGFTQGGIVHVSLSVFDVPVCTYFLWEEPVLFHNFDE